MQSAALDEFGEADAGTRIAVSGKTELRLQDAHGSLEDWYLGQESAQTYERQAGLSDWQTQKSKP